MHSNVNLSPPVIYYRPFQLGAFIVVPSCLMFVLLVILVLFPIMYVSLYSYVWIPDLPPIWVRAADSVCHLSHLFTDITSCCDFFPSSTVLAEFGIWLYQFLIIALFNLDDFVYNFQKIVG